MCVLSSSLCFFTISSLPDCLSFPSFHLCCDCLTRLTTDVNFESLMSPNLLIHSAGEGENLFIPQWTFYPLHPSISHGQLICARLTSSITFLGNINKEKTAKCDHPFLLQPFILFSPSVLLCDIYYASQ